MQPTVALLIVSAHLETKKAVRRILEDLPVNLFTAGTLAQAREVLSRQPIAAIFCEEHLPDGPYSELLAHVAGTPFVLMLGATETREYMRGHGSGTFGVLRRPLQPIDVELTLIHAMRETATVRGEVDQPRA